MSKKLTISVSDDVYAGLYRVIGRRKISRFLEDLARSHVLNRKIDASYEEMAADEARESEALEWSEALMGDVRNEPR